MAPQILDGEDVAADLFPDGSEDIHHVENMSAMPRIRSHLKAMREYFGSMHLPKKHIGCKVAGEVVWIFIISIVAIVLAAVARCVTNKVKSSNIALPIQLDGFIHATKQVFAFIIAALGLNVSKKQLKSAKI